MALEDRKGGYALKPGYPTNQIVLHGGKVYFG